MAEMEDDLLAVLFHALPAVLFQERVNEQIDALTDAEVILEDLADDIDNGTVDHCGDAFKMRKQAKVLREVRSILEDLVKRSHRS